MADKITSILNGLIETSKDGEKGFRSAAEHTKSTELKGVFLKRAEDCAKGAAELQRIVTNRGEEPEQGGSIAGALHRGWINLKTAVTSDDELAILEECERGEDVAKAAYRDALDKGNLPAEIRTVVQRQNEGVQKNHDQIRDLRDRYKSKS
ncbi:MAG: PA2169 family four-helix-bundle protein [Casimicrobiaceae bacterium]